MKCHGSTLLPQFLGMYRLSVDNEESYMVVMRNMFSHRLTVHRKYDLKVNALICPSVAVHVPNWCFWNPCLPLDLTSLLCKVVLLKVSSPSVVIGCVKCGSRSVLARICSACSGIWSPEHLPCICSVYIYSVFTSFVRHYVLHLIFNPVCAWNYWMATVLKMGSVHDVPL